MAWKHVFASVHLNAYASLTFKCTHRRELVHTDSIELESYTSELLLDISCEWLLRSRLFDLTSFTSQKPDFKRLVSEDNITDDEVNAIIMVVSRVQIARESAMLRAYALK